MSAMSAMICMTVFLELCSVAEYSKRATHLRKLLSHCVTIVAQLCAYVKPVSRMSANRQKYTLAEVYTNKFVVLPRT